MEPQNHDTHTLPSDEEIKKLYEEKVQCILFAFNDEVIEIESMINTARTEGSATK